MCCFNVHRQDIPFGKITCSGARSRETVNYVLAANEPTKYISETAGHGVNPLIVA
jgi:hypothetical protein